MKRLIAILNGPNLNLVGTRQPEIYGDQKFDTFILELREQYADIHINYHQTNHEGTLIDHLHHYGFKADGIILNAGGYTHTSIAIADAIRSINTPVVEVHLSDISQREDYRKFSYLTETCITCIKGKGMSGYAEALEILLAHQT